jgi:uncharacterized protein
MTRGQENSARRVPIRTCVGCRQRDQQARLLRVALVEGCATPDPRRRLPGRGAYVHRRTECVDRAARAGNVARALRAPVPGEQVSSLLERAGGDRSRIRIGDGK